jgi:thiosulfate dehydrogenase [quinone] large subunit
VTCKLFLRSAYSPHKDNLLVFDARFLVGKKKILDLPGDDRRQMMSESRYLKTKYSVQSIEDPPVTKALFGSIRWSWIWLIARLYLGWKWVQPGWGKLHNPAWVGAKAGTALTGFLNGALSKTGGEHPDVQTWYATFIKDVVLPHTAVWTYVVSWGEFLVGVALILGAFTGIAAFFGMFMNFNYLLAGSVSINPLLFLVGLGVLLAWKTAGWWGLDRWLLPLLGTPWSPGYIFHHEQKDMRQHAKGTA